MAETFGRGAMTNHWNDIANCDRILAIAANPAENHPAAFGHITEAIDRGARLIVVDPRFTRSAAKAHIYCAIRSGSDVAFIGGIIRYVIDDIEQNPDKYNLTYITGYTNALYLVNPEFQGPADLDGLFTGYDPDTRTYDRSKWTFQTDAAGIPLRAAALEDPDCVFQVLKRHFDRYTPEMVTRVTGAPEEKLLEVARTFAESGAGQFGDHHVCHGRHTPYQRHADHTLLRHTPASAGKHRHSRRWHQRHAG